MTKRLFALMLCASLLICPLSFSSAATDGQYLDVPPSHWAADDIIKAKEYGLMQGVGGGSFGLGLLINRASFAKLLCNMFAWEEVSPDLPTFDDNDRRGWYYAAVETAFLNGACDVASGTFRPLDPITREEMAVMLVRALGYDRLAADVANLPSPFNDVTSSVGHIGIAYDIGMAKGIGDGRFMPEGQATREEAAAMMVRVWQRYSNRLEWLHGFYALSSYSQIGLSPDMDALSLGWSRMTLDEDGEPFLNTTSANSNEFHVPKGFEAAAGFFKENGTPANLSVFMGSSGALLLADEDKRQRAAALIANELERAYDGMGGPIYSGVTIDFEGLSGVDARDNLTRFLSYLKELIAPSGKSLYVAVHPQTADGYYYSGYDYRAIGDIADRVILMAHDYGKKVMDESLVGSSFTATPLTPLPQIYYALRAITDEETGVRDKSKIALAVSFDSIGWKMKEGRVADKKAISPVPSEIYKRLTGANTQFYYSERYKNPYIIYDNDEDGQTVLWYEDARSIIDKIHLSRMFSVNGLSIWRLGLVPNYGDAPNYDVWSAVLLEANRQ